MCNVHTDSCEALGINTSTSTTTDTSTNTDHSNRTMDVAVDSRGVPGWNHVDKLAIALVELHGLCMSGSEAEEILQKDRRKECYVTRYSVEDKQFKISVKRSNKTKPVHYDIE